MKHPPTLFRTPTGEGSTIHLSFSPGARISDSWK